VGQDGVERDGAEEARDGGEAAGDGALLEGRVEVAAIEVVRIDTMARISLMRAGAGLPWRSFAGAGRAERPEVWSDADIVGQTNGSGYGCQGLLSARDAALCGSSRQKSAAH
jgi:hypothetical protein